MYNLYDSRNPFLSSIYFSLLVMIGAFFLLNMLLAAICTNFKKIRNAENPEYNRPKDSVRGEKADPKMRSPS